MSTRQKPFQLKIRTPLWTGDIDSKSDLLQSTGIIGSLRWWTEAILRGMGKFACDPVGDDRCPKEKKAGNTKIIKYCPACLIFGATGMRRLFRIEVNGGTKVFDGDPLNIRLDRRLDRRNRGWYLGSGLVGDIELRIVSLDRDYDENLVLVPLTIAANWGGIGAKTQHGYGVVEIEDYLRMDFNDFRKAINRIINKERLSALGFKLRTGNNDGFQNLKEMFFVKVQFEVTENDWWKEVDGIRPDNQRNYRSHENDRRMIRWIESNSVPISPAIKNWLRFNDGKNLWQTGNQDNRRIENWLFGTIRDNKSASKINVSCAYRVRNNLWEFRIWGWIPINGLTEGFNRDKFLDNLKKALEGSGQITVPWNNILGNNTKNHQLEIWREYNSSRDTIIKDETDIEKFIQSLLKGEGGSQ